MKKSLLLFLLLPACGSEPERNAGGGPGGDPSLLEPVLPAQPSQAELEAKAAQALSSVLMNPQGAQFWNVRPAPGGAVCGEVESRQENGRFGGPRPFVVTPEGVGVVSPTTRVVFGDPGDLFPDFYIRWCATPEELAKLGPGIREEPPAEAVETNMTNGADPVLPEAVPGEVPPAAASPKAEPKSAPAEPAPKLKPPSGDEDSFFNAVIRKKE